MELFLFRLHVVYSQRDRANIYLLDLYLCEAKTLLIQSRSSQLIDVKSICVGPNEMEEILQLLTERDIE